MNNKDTEKAARECMAFEDAEILCKETDYALDACDDGNPINWGDASAFFLEGVMHERNSRQSEIDELREALENLCDVVGKLNDTNAKKYYGKLAIAYSYATQLLEKYRQAPKP